MSRIVSALVLASLLMLAMPAYALDCTRSDIHDDALLSAICTDPDLKQADAEMSRAYQTLIEGRDKQQRRVLQTLQQAWLDDGRNMECAYVPFDGACFARNIRRRTDFLEGADGIGPISQGKLVFKGLYVPRKTVKDATYDISLFTFETPDTDGKMAFNADVEARLETYAAEVQKGDDCSPCNTSVLMAQPLQTGDFISVPIQSWGYGGSRNGYDTTTYLHQNLKSDTPLGFDDLLVDYDASALAKVCYDVLDAAELGPAASVDLGPDGGVYRPSNGFMQAFRDLQNWRFDGKSVKIRFPAFVINNEEQFCDLSYAMLQPHLLVGVKLPVAMN